MTIIKNHNRKIILYLVLVFFSCASQKEKMDITHQECQLFEDTLSRVSFSENQKDLRNLELYQFYDDDNYLDVIIYNNLEGSNEYNLKRFYKNKISEWKKVVIVNDVKNESVLELNELEMIDYLNNIEEKSFFQLCEMCFDCRYYTFLIKRNKKVFTYYSNGEVFLGISKKNKEKISHYISIYDLFTDK